MAIARVHWSPRHHPRLSQTRPLDIVSADSTVEEFGLVGQPALRFAIASGAGETQSREAVSRRTRVSAARGRALETQLQHFSTSIQTSSDSPRMPRFAGRESPSPVRANTGTAWRGRLEDYCSSARTYGSDPSGLICQESSAANLVDNHSKRIDVRLLRRTRFPVEQLRCHPSICASPGWWSHGNADRRVTQ